MFYYILSLILSEDKVNKFYNVKNVNNSILVHISNVCLLFGEGLSLQHVVYDRNNVEDIKSPIHIHITRGESGDKKRVVAGHRKRLCPSGVIRGVDVITDFHIR